MQQPFNSLYNIAPISYWEAKRMQKNKIYVTTSKGIDKEIQITKVIKGVNEQGQGTVIAINNKPALYIEDKNYYPSFADLLDKLKDFTDTIATKPIATTAQGPAPATPELVNKAQLLSQQINKLKQELP